MPRTWRIAINVLARRHAAFAVQATPAGDQWIVVERVEAVRTTPAADPLLFFGGTFCSLRAALSGHDP